MIGDLCRALEHAVLPYCDPIMLQLMRNLIDKNLHRCVQPHHYTLPDTFVCRSVKPPILSCFGDIALAVGADFERFLEHAMTMLYNASQITMDTSDPDDHDYMVQLHENIIEGYSGIIQALHSNP